MTPQLWAHWLSCHTPINQCGRCKQARRIIRKLTGAACPLVRQARARYQQIELEVGA